MARLTPGYVAADLDALAREAAQEAIDRICQAENETGEVQRQFTRESAWERWKEIGLSDEILGSGFKLAYLKIRNEKLFLYFNSDFDDKWSIMLEN